jgi:hypothetical protein
MIGLAQPRTYLLNYDRTILVTIGLAQLGSDYSAAIGSQLRSDWLSYDWISSATIGLAQLRSDYLNYDQFSSDKLGLAKRS